MIKIADESDIGSLQLLSKVAHDELAPGVETDIDRIFDFFEICEAKPDAGVVLLAIAHGMPQGAICLAGGIDFTTNVRKATDFHFYVLPEYRGGPVALKLIRASEKWAKDNNYAKLSITLPNTTKGSFLKRLGFKDSHTVYSKEITCPT